MPAKDWMLTVRMVSVMGVLNLLMGISPDEVNSWTVSGPVTSGEIAYYSGSEQGRRQGGATSGETIVTDNQINARGQATSAGYGLLS